MVLLYTRKATHKGCFFISLPTAVFCLNDLSENQPRYI